MNKKALRKKITDLQQELQSLKKQISSQPDLQIDKTNWNKIEDVADEIREENFEKQYEE